MAKQGFNPSRKGVYIVTYSGVNTIGRNSYTVAKDGRFLVIDFGVGFPDIGAYGIQYIVPNIDWIVRYKNRLDGLVITHAHLDHIGAVPLLLERLNKPITVVGSRFTIEFLKEKLRERKLKFEPKLKVVSSGDIIRLGSFHVEFAHVTHSIPQSMAVAVQTPYGKIVYTGDFKFDPTPINESPSDVGTLRRWAESGIIAALLDSTNAFEKGHSESETYIMGVLEQIIKEAKGRVIIGMFSSLVSRMMGILEIAKKLNKKVAFTGRSLETNVRIAMRIGYLTPDQDTIIPITETHKYDDSQLIIIATGSQGEYQAALTKMARSKHEYIRLRSTDTIILSSSVIPTNVVSVQQLMDLLAFTGATFINSKLMDVHVSGHAYQEDLKEMAVLLNAGYYIPVHGYPSFLFQHKRVLEEAGIPGNRVLIPTEGGVFKVDDKGVTPMKKLKVSPNLVVGGNIVAAKDPLLGNRELLAQYGVFIVCVSRSDGVTRVSISQRGVFSQEIWLKKKGRLRDFVAKAFFTVQKHQSKGDKTKRSKVDKRAFVAIIRRHLKKEYGVTPEIVVNI